MDELVKQYIRSMKLAAGLNTQRIFAAWDACSGAGEFTLKRFFRDGKLYITLSSSVVRNQLHFQKEHGGKSVGALHNLILGELERDQE